MPFMGTDLGKLMKIQRLSEEKIQYFVYQMLKGLKVFSIIYHLIATWFCFLKSFLFFYTVYSFCWYNPQGELIFMFTCELHKAHLTIFL